MKTPWRLSVLVIFIIYFSQGNLMAQSDLRPGYIITTSNDTIFGQIVYKETLNRFEKCNFIPQKGTESKSYSAFELKGYGITNGRIYLSKELNLDSLSKSKIFTEVAVSGKATLVSAYDRLFIDLGADKIYELIQTKSTITKNGTDYIHTVKQYQGILKSTLSGCPKASSLIDNTDYSIKSISKVINKYNECFPDETVKQSKPKNKWFKAQLGVSTGYSVVSLKDFRNSSFNNYVDPAQFKDHILYPGISFEMNSPRTLENLAFHVDIFYQKNSFASFYESEIDYNTTSWEFQSISIPISVVYYFLGSKKGFRLFVEGGISPYFTSNHRTSNQTDIKENDDIILGVTEYSKLDNQSSVFYYGGTGLTYQLSSVLQLATKFRYEDGQFNISEYESLKRNNLSITVSILFNLSK